MNAKAQSAHRYANGLFAARSRAHNRAADTGEPLGVTQLRVIARYANQSPFVFSFASFAAMKARISLLTSKSLSHCSLYRVTGNRPSPYTDTPPFSLTFNETP